MNKLSKKMLAAVMAVMIPVAGLSSAAIAISSVDTSAVAEAKLVSSSGIDIDAVLNYMSVRKGQYLRSYYGGVDWCALFLSDALMANGVNMSRREGYVDDLVRTLAYNGDGMIYITTAGQNNNVETLIKKDKLGKNINGASLTKGTHYQDVGSNFEIKKGDILLFDWEGGWQDADHIEMASANSTGSSVTSIGGNTNGGQVAEQTRPKSKVVAVFRFNNIKNGSSSNAAPSSSSQGLTINDINRFRSEWDVHPNVIKTPYTLSSNLSSTGRTAILGIQTMLKYLGYSIDVDGYYGSGSESVVKSFQSSKGLTVDGKVGNITFNALYNACKDKINASTVDITKAVCTPSVSNLTMKPGETKTVTVKLANYIPTSALGVSSDPNVSFDATSYNDSTKEVTCTIKANSNATAGAKTLTFNIYNEPGAKGTAYKGCAITVNIEQVAETVKTVGSKVTNSSNSHQYQLVYSTKSYEDTAAWAKQQGGYLASIKDKSENDFIYNLCKQNGQSSVYFGLTKASGTWKWESGESFSYSNWHQGEPSGGTEKYGMYYSGFGDSSWNDGNGGKGLYYVVEWGSTAPINDITKLSCSPSEINPTIRPGESKTVTVKISGYKPSKVSVNTPTGVTANSTYNANTSEATVSIKVDSNAVTSDKTLTFYVYDENGKSYKGCDIVIKSWSISDVATINSYVSYYKKHPYVISSANSNNTTETGKKAITGIQDTLKFLGYSVTANGIYDTATENAIKSFQKSQGLSSDGKVNDTTFNALTTAIGKKLGFDDEMISGFIVSTNKIENTTSSTNPVTTPTTPVVTNPVVTPNNPDTTTTTTDTNTTPSTPSQNSSSVTITYADTTTFLSNWRNHPYSVSVSNTSGNSRETGVKTITDIQKMLNFLGYSTPIDGTYSTSTESAIKSFQKDKGLTSDGVVSSSTFNALILACRDKLK